MQKSKKEVDYLYRENRELNRRLADKQRALGSAETQLENARCDAVKTQEDHEMWIATLKEQHERELMHIQRENDLLKEQVSDLEYKIASAGLVNSSAKQSTIFGGNNFSC